MKQSRRESLEGTELHPEPARPAAEPEERQRLVIWVAVAASAVLLLLSIFAPGCREGFREAEIPLAAFPGPVSSAPQVRMAVRQRVGSVKLAVAGPFRLYDGRGAEIPLDGGGQKLGRSAATFSGGCLYLGAQPLNPNGEKLVRIRICPARLGSLEIDGQVYAGDLELIGHPGSDRLSAVARLNIEEYVCGVLAGETPVESWHEEALKAQAVVSRTYALFYSLKNADKPWDFGSSGREAQQYKPGISRNEKVNRAVNLTAGEVLTAENENMIFPAYFHSSCGGHTLDATELFTRLSIEPLRGVECTSCTKPGSHKYVAWRKEIALKTIAARLMREAGDNPNLKPVLKLREVRSLEVAARSPAGSPDGRITRFLARGPMSPGSAELPANDVRGAIGWSELPSTKCRMIPVAGNRYVFEGSGYGHGVGLCQWGSQGLALEGHPYPGILNRYFPGSKLVRMNYGRAER